MNSSDEKNNQKEVIDLKSVTLFNHVPTKNFVFDVVTVPATSSSASKLDEAKTIFESGRSLAVESGAFGFVR
ncbi:MAG: hypothetical protein A0129_12225 [Limnobacter sp. CACIAM 66H1]|uniref:hypothetical protein n=1 Tax=Limnobacter sp. CACIAM 66H1 TaxID=1813033 RepID=UPI0007A84611|nr:hypothetical protein [Limnobacter sp. CACIAM 66H1]KYP10557.1 MAG: hypothetical protein A0129_12225 [Limnobacter sp. CACIAM 66H1]